MAGKKSNIELLLAAGLLGLGLGVLAENQSRRERFRSNLREALAKNGINMVSATLGRGTNNVPFWDVTYQEWYGALNRKRIPLLNIKEPYSDAANDAILAAFKIIHGGANLLQAHGRS